MAICSCSTRMSACSVACASFRYCTTFWVSDWLMGPAPISFGNVPKGLSTVRGAQTSVRIVGRTRFGFWSAAALARQPGQALLGGRRGLVLEPHIPVVAGPLELGEPALQVQLARAGLAPARRV